MELSKLAITGPYFFHYLSLYTLSQAIVSIYSSDFTYNRTSSVKTPFRAHEIVDRDLSTHRVYSDFWYPLRRYAVSDKVMIALKCN